MICDYSHSVGQDNRIVHAAEIGLPAEQPFLSLAADGHSLRVWTDRDDKTGADDTNQVTVVMRGELFDGHADPARRLANRYAALGTGVLSTLDGLFAILVVDRRNGRILFATDLVGSRRLFCARMQQRVLVSSNLWSLPLPRFHLDPIGIGWYLTHGAIHCGRTPFAEISVLDRASTHELAANGLTSTPYWSYDFHEAQKRARPADLSAELASAILSSVRKQASASNLYLALTGGYDSCGIAGILAEQLGVEGVECFSYSAPDPALGSDESVAARVAARIGYHHRKITGYRGPFAAHILKNASVGQGFCHPCEEADLWDELGEEFAATSRPVILFGDECLCNDCRLSTPEEALASVGIGSFHALSFVWDGLPGRSSIHEGLMEDIRTLLRRCPECEDLHDVKDFFFLDQRLRNVHLPVREFFVGRIADVRNPLLGREVLEVMKRVPVHYRRGKRLLHSTLKRMCPRVFGQPRATGANFGFDLPSEFRANRAALKAMLLRHASRLDEFIPAEAASRLLDLPFEAPRRSVTTWQNLRGVGGRALRNSGLRGLFRAPEAHLHPEVALRRYLILREALGSSCGSPDYRLNCD